jgi:ribosomal protein S18 acetylase RimI-like enzyme
MYKLEGLNNININLLKNIYITDEYKFKSNLKEILNSSNFLRRLLLWKNIKFLKVYDEYIGFIWFNKVDKNSYKINSMKLMGSYNSIEYYSMLLDVVKKNSIVFFYCRDSEPEYSVLTRLGFEKRRVILEMKKNLKGLELLSDNSLITFRNFEKNKDEKLRCKIQNHVFSDLSRAPINEEDIYYEQCQKYYIENGCIFINYKGKSVGYGQIISDNDKAYLVNFGILEEYRNKGLGKILLKHLLNQCYLLNYKEIYLKCNDENSAALNLYKTTGFIHCDTTFELYKING